MKENEATITMDMIVSCFKRKTDAKKMREIKEAVISAMTPPEEIFLQDSGAIESQIEALIKADRKLEKESQLEYKNGKYSLRRNKRPIPDSEMQLPADPRFKGAAGECAVMSELLFRGYNANRMIVDEGVDLVAVKENIYYYVQVKTTSVKNGRIICSIDKLRHNQYIGKQMRYIIVARTKDTADTDKNIFFLFTPEKIEECIHQKCVNVGEKGVNIKIKFHEKTQEPLLYDDKEMPIGYYMNNFNL
ncbi:hypothetical protein [uncultured Duncaniella sp.]|uniref:hypothetical protein n=1 Tax=uncultured Duncaniella sp. TaxID=2768039 RepID=UPI000F46021E|nr:hypothetical protein [uncultured Duncaniella sp.]ROS90559.1 hypothetical protein EEL39_01955 [Muribaculaceae bacterium Isolate-080 (Janvier)]